MTPISLTEITRRMAEWRFPAGIDGVVGIASGGVVPAVLVARQLGLEMKVVAVNYRDDGNVPRFAEPKILSGLPAIGSWRRILLVDDVYVSGKSWHAARNVLPPDIDVLPFVLKGKIDCALIRDVDGCVEWPWKVY